MNVFRGGLDSVRKVQQTCLGVESQTDVQYSFFGQLFEERNEFEVCIQRPVYQQMKNNEGVEPPN